MFARQFNHNGLFVNQEVTIGLADRIKFVTTLQRPWAWQWSDDPNAGWVAAHNWAYFCPVCGEIWARAVFDASTHRGKHVPVSQPCAQHPTDTFHVAGSLLGRYGLDGLPHDPLLLEFMPMQLLEREMKLHEAHFERYFS